MTIAGILVIVLGIIVGAPWIWIAGIVVAVVGLVLAICGQNGRLVVGPTHYA